MPVDNEKFKVKQTDCLICKEKVDLYDDSRMLVYCVKCNMKYHKECWDAITSGSCVHCGGRDVDDCDSGFVINETWNN
jgi:hypothetical protein